VKADALLSPQEPCEELVERLEAVLVELERLPLPPGSAGSSLLDAFEIVDRARKRARTAAKAMLVKEPSALPGWRIGGVIGRDGTEKPPSTLMIRRHEREAGLRLIQQRQASLKRTQK
jgi:hypothetical protein